MPWRHSHTSTLAYTVEEPTTAWVPIRSSSIHHTEQRRRWEDAKGVRMKTTGVLDMRLMEVALDAGGRA